MTYPPISGTHPYAEKFPMFGEPELAELAESIAANGLRQPIVVTPEGLILDGRNRHVACGRAGVPPDVVVYEGDDLAEYVIDCNSARRHMSTGSRAMATALVLVDAGRRKNGRWQYGKVRESYGSVESAGTWTARLFEAGLILDHAPDLAEAVAFGTMPLDAAHRTACERRDAARAKLAEDEARAAEEADACAFIEAEDPDLAALVESGALETYAEAKAVWEKRNREEAAKRRAEKERKQREAAEWERSVNGLYTAIGKALQTCAVYGGYDNLTKLMADYKPTRLDPPQLDRWFQVEELQNVRQFADMLIEWQETRRG